MSHDQRDPDPASDLIAAINQANQIFADRHNWLSPTTTDQERMQFVARCCRWWNDVVCPTMEKIGVVWNERKQRFEISAVTRW